MNTANRDSYHSRFRKVLEYIDTHLDSDLSAETLSRVAAFSKYHFHRQFAEYFGVGVYQYVQLCRLKRASYQLAFRRHRPVLAIALDCGYEGPEAFSRAFKKRLGQSPSAFRNQPQWASWHRVYQPLSKLRSMHMQNATLAAQVKIVDFKETKVAVLEHRGDPQGIGNSICRFIAWRKAHHLPPAVSATFNIAYDDPASVPPEDYRMDLCAATDEAVAGNEWGIVAKVIPGGRCAVLRHVGSDDTLGETASYLYTNWLPQSGETLRDFPMYFQRVKFFPDVPENEAVVDVFLPLS